MSQRQHVTEWTTYDHLCFSAKVQCLVDEATCCNLEIFINRLAEMGSALSTYSRARLYILKTLIGRVLEADAETRLIRRERSTLRGVSANQMFVVTA